MIFIPFENIKLKSKLKSEEVLLKLSLNIEEEQFIRFNLFNSSDSKPYEGSIKDNSFEIKRIMSYRNSFRPIVSGIVNDDFDGSTIELKFRLNVFVTVFLVFWVFQIINLTTDTFTNFELFSNFNLFSLIPVGMILFMYIITMGGFIYESSVAKKDLKEYFKADIIES